MTARSLAAFQRTFAVPWGVAPSDVIGRALLAWSTLAGANDVFDPAFEVAWLILDDAGLAPSHAPVDPGEQVLAQRRDLFMALVPDGEAWVRYLSIFPSGDANRELRARRSRRARLLHGAVHPDLATLCAPPDGPIGDFVRRHLGGPSVCLECRRRKAPSQLSSVAAASTGPFFEIAVLARDANALERELVVTCFEDDGCLRTRIAPAGAGQSRPLSGDWHIALHTDDVSFTGTIRLPDEALFGRELGPLPEARPPLIHRLELRCAEEPAA